MKIKKTIAMGALALSTTLAPVNKADACLFLVSPMAFIVGIGVSASTLLPYLVDYDGTIKSSYDTYSNGLFFGLISASLLDENQSKLEAGLSNAFPSIPSYIISEASILVREKASHMEFDSRGVKAVSLTEAEFMDLSSAMPSDVSATELAAFKKILTSAAQK